MKELSASFKSALHDYLYLMEHKYPEKLTLKLVSDRYALSGEERSMLFRGVVTAEKMDARKTKIIKNPKQEESFIIDGYNVIRTVGSYLNGNLVFVAMDGLLRDASEIHKKAVRDEVVLRSLDLILETLKNMQTASAWFYLDSPVSKSGELAAYISRQLSLRKVSGMAETVHSPDHYLKKAEKGILCTSDSAIIDECMLPVFDLAGYTLQQNFSPEFIHLAGVL